VFTARAVCGVMLLTAAALFYSSSLLFISNSDWTTDNEAGRSVSVNGNEEPAGEICHQYSSVVTAITPYSRTIKLQYTVHGDYWVVCGLPVLTWVPGSVPPENNIQDTILIGSATDTTCCTDHWYILFLYSRFRTYESQYGSNASYFGLRSYNYKVSFAINTHFPPLRQKLLCQSRWTFAEVSELFTHTLWFSSSSLHGVLAALPSGGQKDGSRWVLNQGRREEEGEESTAVSLLLPLWAHRWAVWCCHAGRLDYSSYVTEPFNSLFQLL